MRKLAKEVRAYIGIDNYAERTPLSGRLLSGVVGRATTPYQAMIMGTSAPLKKAPTPVEVEKILAGLTPEQRKALDGYTINLGGSSFKNEMAKTIGNLSEKNMLAKGNRALSEGVGWTAGSLTRSNVVNPTGKTITIYNNEPILMAKAIHQAVNREIPKKMSLGARIMGLLYGNVDPGAYTAQMDAIRNSGVIDKTRANRILGGEIGAKARVVGGIPEVIGEMAARTTLGMPMRSYPSILKGIAGNVAIGAGVGQILGRLGYPYFGRLSKMV